MGRASQSHRPVGNRIRARIRAETGSLLATDQGASREGIRGTNEHRVQATVSRGRLLVYDIRQGWGPLCDFLECPTPTVDFPNLNDRELLESMPEAVASGDSSLAAKWGKGLQAPKIRTGEGAQGDPHADSIDFERKSTPSSFALLGLLDFEIVRQPAT